MVQPDSLNVGSTAVDAETKGGESMSNGKISSRTNGSGRNVMQKTTSRMWMCSRTAVRVAILLALALSLVGFGPKGYVNGHSGQVVLNFEPTTMLLPNPPNG